MDRETLISKWLNHELSEKELEAFKQLDDYNELVKLQAGVKKFQPSDFDTASELKSLQNSIKNKKTPKKLWPTIAKIAALLVIGFLAFNYFSNQPTTIQTLASEKSFIELPDQSTINLNAASQVSYNHKHWDKTRRISLQGEAYFDVTKGATFKVETPVGTVTVYGTQFNVKHRNKLFEVVCYEGLVGVLFQGEETLLRPNERIFILNNQVLTSKDSQTGPSWIEGMSTFKSTPYGEVLAELERQYNIKITLNDIDPNLMFSGSFTHNNIELALKAITIPVNANFEKAESGYTIIREK